MADAMTGVRKRVYWQNVLCFVTGKTFEQSRGTANGSVIDSCCVYDTKMILSLIGSIGRLHQVTPDHGTIAGARQSKEPKAADGRCGREKSDGVYRQQQRLAHDDQGARRESSTTT
jgi:hypothetical protein